MFCVLKNYLKGSHPGEMARLLLSETEKGIRTRTSTNVMAPLEANRGKINLLHKLCSYDV